LPYYLPALLRALLPHSRFAVLPWSMFAVSPYATNLCVSVKGPISWPIQGEPGFLTSVSKADLI
jgi:hypothetical protein